MPVIRQRKRAARFAGDAAFDRGRVEIGKIHEHRAGVDRPRVGIRLDITEIRLDARDTRPLVEDAAIADHDEARAGADLVEGCELRGQFRANAGGISHRERDNRAAVARCVHMIRISSGLARSGTVPRSTRTICRTSGSSSSATPPTTRLVTSRLAKKIPSEPFDINIDCRNASSALSPITIASTTD